MAFKPKTFQLSKQTGMGRPGGMASMGSKPPVMRGSKGANFSAMENTLLKGSAPNPTSLSGIGGGIGTGTGQASGRQFYTNATGADLGQAMSGPSPIVKMKRKAGMK